VVALRCLHGEEDGEKAGELGMKIQFRVKLEEEESRRLGVMCGAAAATF